MENIDKNKISGVPLASPANKASAHVMNQQETYLEDSTGRLAGLANAPLREGSSFLYAIYAKKNNNSLDNKFKQIYDLNNLRARVRRAGEPEACITSLARKIIEAKAKNLPVFYKHFPPAIKEWNNSIFTYNPNLTVSLTVIDKMVIKIIKSYFNSYYLEDTSKNHLRKNNRQLRVINKAYFSKLTVKHTNSKVTITVYLYATLYKKLD